MATNIPNITPLPAPPQSNDPTNFDQKADVFVQALQGMSTELATSIPKINTVANEVEASASNAAAAATTAVNAPGSASTSTTSHSVSSGSKTFTTQTGKAWAVGQVVNVARTSNPANVRMQAVVTSYNSGNGALVLSVIAGSILGGGATNYTDWTITLAGGAVPMSVVDRAYNEQLGYNVSRRSSRWTTRCRRVMKARRFTKPRSRPKAQPIAFACVCSAHSDPVRKIPTAAFWPFLLTAKLRPGVLR